MLFSVLEKKVQKSTQRSGRELPRRKVQTQKRNTAKGREGIGKTKENARATTKEETVARLFF